MLVHEDCRFKQRLSARLLAFATSLLRTEREQISAAVPFGLN
jgi:hypothetical protein